jgi:hypothetical protein
MKKTLLVLSITLLGILSGANVMAQTTAAANNVLSLGLVEVCMLSTISTPVSLTLAPTTAGLAIQPSVSDESTRLQISSIVTGTKDVPVPHIIQASLLAGSTVPAGTFLSLQATVVTGGSSGGTLGVSKGDVKLPMATGSAVPILDGIGSCFSGSDAADGYKLKYTWGVDLAGLYADIRATTGTSVTVILTLSKAP